MLRKNRSTCSPGLQDPMPAAGFPAGLSHLKDVSLMSYIVIHIFAFGDFVLSLKQKQPFVVKLGMVHYWALREMTNIWSSDGLERAQAWYEASLAFVNLGPRHVQFVGRFQRCAGAWCAIWRPGDGCSAILRNRWNTLKQGTQPNTFNTA